MASAPINQSLLPVSYFGNSQHDTKLFKKCSQGKRDIIQRNVNKIVDNFNKMVGPRVEEKGILHEILRLPGGQRT